jgi:hypothetical protein
MGRDELFDYKTLSPDDRRTFDGWLKSNALIGSILAAGLVAMAVAGSSSGPSPMTADANSATMTRLYGE